MSEATVKKMDGRIKGRILPLFGDKPINSLTPQMFLDFFKSLADKGLFKTAEIISSCLTRTYDRAMLLEKCAGNPAQVARKIYLRETKKEVRHLKARLEPQSIRELFSSCLEYGNGRCDTVRNALLFQALTACRPGNARRAEWSEIDMERKIWAIPAEKMKTRKSFNIPLAPFTLAVLAGQKKMASKSKYVFPGKNNARPISDMALSVALKTMGVRDHVPHGWRSSFSTTLNESGKFRREAIDMCLAHKVGDAVEQAYNRSQLWNERVEIFNWWADFLTKN